MSWAFLAHYFRRTTCRFFSLVRSGKEHRGVELISDGPAIRSLVVRRANATENAIGHAQFILLSWFGAPCVLAIPPSPRLRCAQAREEEAETL